MLLASPWLLALLVFLPALAFLALRRRKGVLPVPSAQAFLGMPRARWRFLRHGGLTARLLALAFLAFALARPVQDDGKTPRSSEGLDIVLILDTSKSMEAQDFLLGGARPTRLTVVKKVVSEFIAQRPSDRIGLVVFGTEAFTQAPITLDHQLLLRFLDRIEIGMAGDATAIGDGLATAVTRLKDLDVKSRVAILLTDGGNTAGRVDPLAAAEAARTLGVKVYTIGVGQQGEIPVDMGGRVTARKSDVDFELLQKIATATDGRSYLASDTEALRQVYETIGALEKTKLQVETFELREERFAGFAWAALALLGLELLFALSRFWPVP